MSESKHAVRSRVERDWFQAEDCNYAPDRADFAAADAVERYILHGLMPDRPFIDRATRITAFGSCFAVHVQNHLNRKSFSVLTKSERNAYVVHYNNIMVNTFAIRQQFEWAFENKVPAGNYWYGYRAQEFGYDEAVRRETLKLFLETEVFILTLGLSEVWYDTESGDVFWRAVPRDKYDPARHRFRVSSVAENKDNIRAIYELIRSHRPGAKVVFTLSPIPLNSTHRPESCLVANCVSKSILRCALDEVYRDLGGNGDLFYFPSYEIINEAFRDPFEPDRRHVKQPIVHFIMSSFERHFCTTGSDHAVAAAYAAAKAADAEAEAFVVENLSIQAGNVAYVEWLLNDHLKQDRFDAALALVRRAAALNPGEDAFHFLKSQFAVKAASYDEALAAAAEAVRLAPGLVNYRRQYGTVLSWFGRLDEAYPHLEAARAAGEGDFYVFAGLSSYWKAAGEVDKAAAFGRQSLRFSPNAPTALRYQAELELQLGNLDEALACAERAAAAAPGAESREVLARVRARLAQVRPA